ncbi:uncharacterized protein LOC124951991 isoform X1 [Vespa velutina]|uniref:uncharacterized protein LOC124951991 isoform X1 n=2 Tax=Vespa velutina TaxID=202808 RepID=UPI001FB3018C|nr:uncharacterized protein LOC124951991 isoform X1 [Vespa velutina]XP_047357148.1 uncharacterized protein LOC124951991 isoform X1 [Vespa velutina]
MDNIFAKLRALYGDVEHWGGSFTNMVAEAYYIRNPYPVPDVSREGCWTAGGPVLGDKVLRNYKDWDLKLTPYERLFAHHTLNSIRKDCRLIRPKVPNDSLDLALNSIYVHSKDTLVPKMYTIMQPETLGRETWRVLKNEIKIVPKKPILPVEQTRKVIITKNIFESSTKERILGESLKCYRGPVTQDRIHPSSVKLAMEGPHTDQSNPGYSRKIDGTFYNI